MASRMQQVCDAVVVLLEAGESAGQFTKPIVTERQYDTVLQLEDTDTISVLVVPVRSEPNRITEGTYGDDIVIDVLVRKRFAQTDYNSEGLVDKILIDEYVDLLEQIQGYMMDPDNHQLDTYTDAVLQEFDSGELDRNERDLGIRFAWIPKHLAEWHQYTGVVRVCYRVEVAY